MKKIIYLSLILALSTACKDIVSTDISDSVPVMILPQVNDTVATNPVHFKWEEVNGATKYRIQIVSPSFASISTYAVDSIVSSTAIFLSLDSNQYEVMLTAMNEGYTSHAMSPIRFWVGIQPSTSSSVVTLLSPMVDTYFNEDFNNNFSWATVSNASGYEFSIRKGSSYQSGTEINTMPGIVTNQYDLTSSLDDGEYHWGVKAYFSSGNETAVSTRRFYIDTINPLVPTLVSPTSNVATGDVTFTWTNATDPGVIHSPVYAIIEVAEDANFTLGFVSTETVSNASSTIINLSGTGTRYWRIKSLDEAGNSSSYSNVAQFTLF